MRPYLISLAAGLLVGVIYNLLSVKSPAPPAIALVGLLGMLIGEQAVPTVRGLVTGQPLWPAAAASPHPPATPKASVQADPNHPG